MLKFNSKKALTLALILFTANSFGMVGNKPTTSIALNKNIVIGGAVASLVVGGATAGTVYVAKKVYNKIYNNREALINKPKKDNSSVSNKIESFGNFLESKNLPGKSLVDGAKTAWNNKIASIATFLIVEYYVDNKLRATSVKLPLRTEIAIITTLLTCKLGSMFSKYEQEQKQAEKAA